MGAAIDDAFGISPMNINQRKEQFSNAYLQAVSSVAGFTATSPTVDDDSIDWMLSSRGINGTPKRPRVDLQLKCTVDSAPDSPHISYALPLKNYNDLRVGREDLTVPRILVVVLVPDDIEFWLEQSEERLLMRHCGYWTSLRGKEEVGNKTTVTVRLPRSNRFTVDGLTSIMQGIGNGDWP